VTDIFNVKSCSKLEIKEAEDMGTALSSLAAGNVLTFAILQLAVL
jgi:hypothetical protein